MISSKTIRKPLFVIVATSLALELVSAIALQSLQIHTLAYPWSFITVLSYGLISPVLVGLTSVGIVILLWYSWRQIGVYRVIAHYATIAMMTIIATFLMISTLFPHDMIISLAISSALLAAGFLWWFLECYYRDQPFGNAHFANTLEIAQAGFFKKTPESIIIGKAQQAPLYANGFEHVLIFAPSGSGKTTSISIPNLLHFPYSCVVNDVKLTLFNTTAKYREEIFKNRCYCCPNHRKLISVAR